MLTGTNIICVSSIDWDFVWQGHQEIMSTLVEQGNRVLFIENTGVRAPGIGDLRRLQQRFLNWHKGTKGFRQERDRLFVYSPLILPFPYARLARWVNRHLMRQALERWMRAAKFYRPVIWTFLPTPLVLDLIRELEPELTIYHCADDFASSSPGARRIARSEARLLKEADLVFVTSGKLQERARRYNPRVHLFPGGVNVVRFEQVRTMANQVPEDLLRLGRPVVGYVGGIHQWIDQDLLETAARCLPHAHFVLIGPCQADVSRLARHANVHFLGTRPHADVPRYVKGFDIGTVPYRSSTYTAHVSPTKLYEYLAMGLPVVSADLPEVRRFNKEYGSIVTVADHAEGFVHAIQEALAGSSPGAVQRRLDVARQNDWTRRIEQMSLLIEQQLVARRTTGMRWDESLRRLYRQTRRHIIQPVVAMVAVYVLLFQSSFIWWLAEPLRMTGVPGPADAIVVFAGGVGESGKAGGGYQERVKQALNLYQEGTAPWVIFSSGFTFVFREAEVMKGLAVDHGVPASAIILETKAANTFENVGFVHAILKERGWRKVLFVSSPYHMRRAVSTWRKLAPEVEVIATPVAKSQFYVHGRGANLEQIRGILHEYAGILYYWLKGWI